MTVALLLPAFGFLCGLGLASIASAAPLKALLASGLARGFIPVVIIYNMVFYQAGSLSLMLFSFASAVLLFYFFQFIFKDKLRALCVSYVNLAWLGFPFALALFGPGVSAPMVALYVGGSIFGNIWAVSAVSPDAQPWASAAKKAALSPPVLALLLAGIFRLLGLQHLQEHHWIELIYQCAKIGMSFSGMCVLGMWMRRTRVHWQDILRSSRIFALKLLCGAAVCSLAYAFAPIPQVERYIGVMLLLFCLPPAANIVALETHYQGTGASAQYIASGTIVSCALVGLYGLALHLI